MATIPGLTRLYRLTRTSCPPAKSTTVGIAPLGDSRVGAATIGPGGLDSVATDELLEGGLFGLVAPGDVSWQARVVITSRTRGIHKTTFRLFIDFLPLFSTFDGRRQ